MSYTSTVFVLVLAGSEEDALRFARRRYPGCQTTCLPKRELRESGWRLQLRKLRELRGKALLIFTDSLESLREPMLLKWTTLVHRCRETVLADSSGSFEVTGKTELIRLLPRSLMAAVSDLIVLACARIGLSLFRVWLTLGRKTESQACPLDLVYLFPAHAGLNVPGGALTHVTGFLSGMAQDGARVAVLSGQRIETSFELHYILGSERHHLFRETATLSFNFRFIMAARRLLMKRRARLLYQRHGKFVFAGAVLSRLLGIPLALEYNGSEDWIAAHWDPVRFTPWLRLCEAISVKAASLVVVVSNVLKQELVEAGVPEERILVNPNAVDPERFHPGCGGTELRPDLGFLAEDVVVCFVGSFSYWHGVAVLEQAIRSLLDSAQPSQVPLKFLLVGDGPLAPQLRYALGPYVRSGQAIFTGSIPHEAVRAYLDAADILVSPHVPMPGNYPFFGSPTKLFEYMAMGKAIAASALEQIVEVLEHGKTALLVAPGDPVELVTAIQRLATDPRLRAELGRNARATALTHHTWRQNAGRVLACASNDQRSAATGCVTLA
jgi:glycosyltransferase involved in cell wall biosynthesis